MSIRLSRETLLANYVTACAGRNVDQITAFFTPGAVVLDPISPPIKGRKAISAYFGRLYDDLVQLELTSSPVYWRGDRAACQWFGRAVRKDGSALQYEGVDVFSFSGTGLISRMEAYWDPKDFA